MARNKKPNPLLDRVVYTAARAVSATISCFDPDGNAELAAILGQALATIDRKHLIRSSDHLRLAFPDWPEERIHKTARQTFEHLVLLAFEALQTPHVVTQQTWRHRIEPDGLGPGLRVLTSGRPSILVTGHLGNWEVIGYALGLLGFPIAAVARPLDNPLINQWLLGVREKRGMRVINKRDAMHQLQDIIENNGSVAFVADQNAGDRGQFVPFFGRLASHYKSIGMLAMKNRCPIVCGTAWRINNRFQFRLGVQDIIEPEEWEAQPDPMLYITARYSRAIEAMIRVKPEQYFWMHRRWKSRPRHEKAGKPFPDKLKASLAQLPWMDESSLNAIVTDSETLAAKNQA
ncbi:lysophospholipid acyltransferase family protein [Mucisphaera sp.]|uniref:lysophospholipid acyltransferase family protein n=1 Tax=Mucisphaera sp. TaxID=2913024 RepID=UPI003D0BE937